ncbi:MAG: glycoside hydrolase family 2 protein [Halanaerobium sp.]
MRKLLQKLNQNWEIKKDADNIGVQKKWYVSKFEQAKSVDVSLPWQCYGKDFINYTGYLWYQKTFELSSDLLNSQEEILIEFEAVDYIADVWLNGNYLGKHEGGYISFQFKITEYLKFKQNNILTVRVFDPEHNEEIPHGKQGSWYTRVSGIWQDVNLKKISSNHIKNAYFETDIDNHQLSVKLDIEKQSQENNDIINLKIFSPVEKEKVIKEVQVDYSAQSDITVKIEEPYLWSPAEPNLYDIEIELIQNNKIVDRYTDYFGMRKIEVKNGKIFLNNEELFIRGALDQAFWPEKIYKPKNREAIIDEIEKAKAMGFNLLRKHIKTPLPEYLELADRMGILIWQEAPNYSKWNKQARERFKKEYTAMVQRDYNHPSIIIWSIYNEEWGLEWDLKNDVEKQQWVSEFYDYAKDLDNTRIICDNSGWAHVKTDINDYHRYFATPENSAEWSQDLDSLLSSPSENFVEGYEADQEPIIMSEFGMWGLPDYSSLISQYKELPEWFNGSAVIFDEDFKIPKTLEINFDKYRLGKIFRDYDQLAAASQKREFVGVKYQIEEMRKRKDKGLGGYVVTELTDIEWETNGFLDYFRNYKYDLDLIREFNSELILSFDIEKRKLWSGQKLEFTPYIINDQPVELEAKLIIKFDGKLFSEEKVVIEKNSSNKLEKMEIVTSELNQTKYTDLEIQLIKDDRVIARNKEEILIAGRGLIDNEKQKCLENKTADDFLITTKLDEDVLNQVWQGKSALFLAEKGEEIADKSLFNFKKLKRGESWDKAASYHFINNNKLGGNLIDKISTWELKNIYPDYTITNLEDLYSEDILSGYFSGWLGRVGATTLIVNYGKAKIIITTLKLEQLYTVDPIATLLFNELFNLLKEEG